VYLYARIPQELSQCLTPVRHKRVSPSHPLAPLFPHVVLSVCQAIKMPMQQIHSYINPNILYLYVPYVYTCLCLTFFCLETQ